MLSARAKKPHAVCAQIPKPSAIPAHSLFLLPLSLFPSLSQSLLLHRYPAQTTFVYFNLACGRLRSADLAVAAAAAAAAAACCNLTSPSQSRPAALNNCFRFCRRLLLELVSWPPSAHDCRCTCHFLCEFASRICSLPHNATPAKAAAPVATTPDPPTSTPPRSLLSLIA